MIRPVFKKSTGQDNQQKRKEKIIGYDKESISFFKFLSNKVKITPDKVINSKLKQLTGRALECQ